MSLADHNYVRPSKVFGSRECLIDVRVGKYSMKAVTDMLGEYKHIVELGSNIDPNNFSMQMNNICATHPPEGYWTAFEHAGVLHLACQSEVDAIQFKMLYETKIVPPARRAIHSALNSLHSTIGNYNLFDNVEARDALKKLVESYPVSFPDEIVFGD